MIILQPFTRADFPQLMAWLDNERLLKEWAGDLFSFPLTEEGLAWYIEDSNDLRESDVFIYKAVDPASGQTVGHISLGGISRYNRAGRVTRVLLAPEARGRGYCQQMIKAVAAIGFEQLGLHRLSLGVYDFNQGAIRCYERSGFRREGTLRDVVRYEDEFWTLIEMGMLEDEWRQATAAALAA